MKAKILLIEDDASLRRGLEDNLIAQGWEVRSACDGEEGLRLALEWKACLLYTSPSPRDRTRSRMPSSA